MCGLFAIFGQDESLDQYIDKSSIKKSFFEFNFRGPDNSSFIEYSNKSIKSYLGHHRLKILDLTSESNQPLIDDSIILLFNGEIFNFKELNYIYFRNEDFKSDTILLFNLIKKIGFDETLKLIKGQYAIIVYDLVKGEILCSSDFYGQKPIYYLHEEECIIISSNLNSITKVLKNKKLSYDSINCYQLLNYIPFSHTPFENIKRVPKNTSLRFTLSDKRFVLNTNNVKKNFKKFEYNKNINEFESNLTEIIKLHLNTDVPISALLSGGIDSSVLCLLISKITKDIETFSISFGNAEVSEENEIKSFAKQLGLKNNIIKPTIDDFYNFYTQSSEIYDEPFSDSSSINTYVISKIVANKYKTCITGDGGDELFFGYSRYYFDYLMRNIKTLPQIFKYFKPLIKLIISDEMHFKKITNYFDNKNGTNYHKYYTTLNPEISNKSHFEILDRLNTMESENINTLRDYDFLFYLPYDILIKNDRASMYNSLELRSPFLYEDTLSLSNSFVEGEHINFWNKKRLLKKVLKNNNIKYKNQKKGFRFNLYDFLIKNFTNQYIKKRYNLIRDINECDKFSYPEEIREDNSEIIWNRLILANWLEKNY